MSIINVNYNNVFDTMGQAPNNISNGTSHANNLLQRARSQMGQLGGVSNQTAQEGIELFERSTTVMVEAVNHFITAIVGSAQHLQAEEGIIAKSFDLQ
ncbi:MAG: hypothetical protein FWC71_07170 [Defluviitaleaceae bacterium]|nr:hypothetical protein [Defluviitaleaceae bacterium]